MDLSALLIVMLGVGLGFFVGTVAGFGAALIALPILLIALPLQEAVAVISIIYFVFSVFHIWRNWKLIDRKTIAKMALGIVIGLVFGAFWLTHGSPEILKKLLGIFVLGYVIYSLFNLKKSKHLNHSFLFGFLGGTTASMFSTSGPVYITHLTSKFDRALMLRANIIGVVGFTDIIRVPILAANGVLTSNVLMIVAACIPAFFIATYFGLKINKRINEKVFRYGVLGILAISSTMLIFG